MLQNENSLILAGEVVTPPAFSHKTHDKSFFSFKLSITRLSGISDCITILICDELLQSTAVSLGDFIEIEGSLRSFNNKSGIGNRLIITAFANEIKLCANEYKNEIHLSGTLCKNTIYRKTPLGREICDLMLAINRKYNRTDYIPCITWGNNAARASSLCAGNNVKIKGRIQSREYIKTIDNVSETKVTYEVSVSELIFP